MPYGCGMPYGSETEVERDELVLLIMEALLAHPAFRPRRRTWAETRERDEDRARRCAIAIVDHLQRCGLRWGKRAPLAPHSAGE